MMSAREGSRYLAGDVKTLLAGNVTTLLALLGSLRVTVQSSRSPRDQFMACVHWNSVEASLGLGS